MAVLSGGDRLTARLDEISRRVGRGVMVRIGFLEGATYPDGKSVAMIAAIQEFGAPAAGIPPRPFFRDMIAVRSEGWPAAVRANLAATGYDAGRAFARVGEGIAGQLRQSILDFVGEPLKPATVARKGFDKQLIDTSHMLNSVNYEVVTK
jgi:hypothetical protein